MEYKTEKGEACSFRRELCCRGDKMKITFSVAGEKEVIGNLSRLKTVAKRAVKEQIGKSALNIQKGAKQRCPVDTGALRNSITVEYYGDTSAEIAPHMPYAAYVEFGTKKQAAQPYMVPAAEEERPNLIKGIEEAIRGEID